MSDYVTTTVEALHRALPEPTPTTVRINGKDVECRQYHCPDGVEVRLRTATFAFFPLGYVELRGKGYWISLRRSKRMRQGGVYMPVVGDTLIDVRGLEIPEADVIEVRGWRDMSLSDLDAPYKEDS